jgi:hypothetical protein
MTSRAAWLLAAAVLAAPAMARADDATEAPAPPTLPSLTHKHLVYDFELTAASIQTKGEGLLASGNAYAWFTHHQLEAPLKPRAWYVGVAQDIAAASVPGVGSAYVLGNPELWGRGIWSSVLGLSSGGTLGIVLPVPRDLNAEDAVVLKTIRTVRPWDVAYFNDLTLTFRPSFDIRHVVGGLVFQLRQGLDWSIALRRTLANDAGCAAGRGCSLHDLTARTTFYVGYRASERIGFGLEIWEVYQLTAEIPDDKRAALAVSPSIRLMFPHVQPALSLLMPIATPLRGDVESYFALRLDVRFDFAFTGLQSSR